MMIERERATGVEPATSSLQQFAASTLPQCPDGTAAGLQRRIRALMVAARVVVTLALERAVAL